MGWFLLGYGVIRNVVLKHRKEFGFLVAVSFAAFLCYSYMNEGRIGKVYSLNVDYEGPDLLDSFPFMRNFDQESAKKLGIGEAAPNPLDAEKVVERLVELEKETLEEAREAINGSLLDAKPGEFDQLHHYNCTKNFFNYITIALC